MKAGAHQFWDTSSLVALVFEEIHSPLSRKARDFGGRRLAWSWMQIEAYSALARRGGQVQAYDLLRFLLGQFEFISIGLEDHPSLERIMDKHRLKAADTGHLFCLMKSKVVAPDVSFVCCDNELSRAAHAEGVRIFS